MCETYDHKCMKCKKTFPIHLGAFKTEPEEIEVYCEKHLPEKDVTVYERCIRFDIADDGCTLINPELIGTFGIRYLTANARKRKDINHPNADWLGQVEYDKKGKWKMVKHY